MLVRFFILLVVLQASLILGGCIAYQLKAEYTSPMDQDTIARIKPGTTLSEVFTWLGPPDYIIDGTRRIIDAAGGPLRTLIAPEGTVILVYSNTSTESTFVGGGVVPGAQARSRLLVADLFIIVSKKDKHVLETARSVPAQ